MKKQKIYTLMTVALLLMSVPLVQNNFHVNATTVSKSDFKNVVIMGNVYNKYFTANGRTSISGRLATLTANKENKAGNTILNAKMSLSESLLEKPAEPWDLEVFKFRLVLNLILSLMVPLVQVILETLNTLLQVIMALHPHKEGLLPIYMDE